MPQSLSFSRKAALKSAWTAKQENWRQRQQLHGKKDATVPLQDRTTFFPCRKHSGKAARDLMLIGQPTCAMLLCDCHLICTTIANSTSALSNTVDHQADAASGHAK